LPILPEWITGPLQLYALELATLALFLSLLLLISRTGSQARAIRYSAAIVILAASTAATCYTTPYACPGAMAALLLVGVLRGKGVQAPLVALLLAYAYYSIAVIYSVGKGSLMPAGYDEWSDFAAAHYIASEGGLQEARSIRAGYYEYPILPAVEAALVLATGASPGVIQATLSIVIASVYFIIVGFWSEHRSRAALLGAAAVLLMLFMNPRLRVWDVIPHIYAGVYALAVFYLMERYRLSPAVLVPLALAGIIAHLVFLLFLVLYAVRELALAGSRASKVKIHVLALLLTVAYVYYSSTGVLAYLIGEVFNVGVYKRIPATLSTGTVPLYAYLLPLATLTLTLLTGSARRKIVDATTGAAVLLGILLGLSGKATYGRHLAASGYLFAKAENLDARLVLGSVALTLAGAVLLSGAIAVGIANAGDSLDWAPHKFCSSGFSIPCLEDSEASRELASLLSREGLVGAKILPEPRIDPTLRYWLLVRDYDLAEKIDSKLVKDSRDSRLYPPPGEYDRTALFYNSRLYPGLAAEKNILYNGFWRVFVVEGASW